MYVLADINIYIILHQVKLYFESNATCKQSWATSVKRDLHVCIPKHIVVYDIMLLVTRFSRCGACQLLHLLQDSVRKYGVPGNTAWKAKRDNWDKEEKEQKLKASGRCKHSAPYSASSGSLWGPLAVLIVGFPQMKTYGHAGPCGICFFLRTRSCKQLRKFHDQPVYVLKNMLKIQLL